MTAETNTLFQRYVDVPCPSGKHQRSICTFDVLPENDGTSN